jgi:anti-sigma factor RsiW
MELNCHDALPLIGSYLDGELSETRATLLRKHLLECHTCRNGAQEGKVLKRWFAPVRAALEEPTSEFAVRVPAGFAARVARRAFAGDTGEREVTLTPARAPEGKLLSFVLRATAVAAALAFVLAVGYRMQSRPGTSSLSADDRAPMSVQQIQNELERLNRENGTLADSAQPGERRRAKDHGALGN